MKTAVEESYKLIYSLNFHPVLGPLIQPYLVKLNSSGNFSLSFQHVYSNTINSFNAHFNHTDLQLIKMADEFSAETLTRKYHKKHSRPKDFFDKELSEKILTEHIKPFIEGRLIKMLEILKDHQNLYFFHPSGNPTSKPIKITAHPSSISFYFKKRDDGTYYYPVIKNGQDIIRPHKFESRIITFSKCWLLVDDKLYSFKEDLNGKKLIPFLKKEFIHISSKNEVAWYKKFVKNVIERYETVSDGFEIKNFNYSPKPVLKMEKDIKSNPAFILAFKYGTSIYNFFNPKEVEARFENNNGKFHFTRIERNKEKEKALEGFLERLGLEKSLTGYFYPRFVKEEKGDEPEPHHLINWLNLNKDSLIEHGFEIEQNSGESKFFVGNISLELDIKEENDWFDIYAMAVFGPYKIPFVKLRRNILNNIREFELPSGEIALLPKEWFSRFREIFHHANEDHEGEAIGLKKHHFNLVDSLSSEDKSISKSIIRTLQKLNSENKPKIPELPVNFTARLRSYQKKGYAWMHYLKDNGFGGCLADDMGLGKTLQALALLQKEKEKYSLFSRKGELSDAGQLDLFSGKKIEKREISRLPSLIVMPTSLIHNWEEEIKKFAPSMTSLKYTGLNRDGMTDQFHEYDVILSTYGIVRNDIEILKEIKFNYIILDESQLIKNPSSKISRLIKQLNSDHRLVLTGTPIENSLTDLWSQMSFLNPGLLGGFKFFKKEYVLPIEKKNDEEKRDKLKALIKPFILRRTKEEVAKDLPSLTEKVQFCEMEDDQKRLYEKLKSLYRNQILENIEKFGFNKSQFLILKGLTELRQLANHPGLIYPDKDYPSGKFDEITRELENVISENHKILLFSQFVRHLNLFRDYLDEKGHPYSYLTGQTRNRKDVIDKFRNDKDQKVFLISLKAGGVGLNLIEADYVFIADPWWNPSVELQAINRAHRIGQKSRVFSYKFITKDSIEEKILKLQSRKFELARDIVQTSTSIGQLITEEDIRLLLD